MICPLNLILIAGTWYYVHMPYAISFSRCHSSSSHFVVVLHAVIDEGKEDTSPGHHGDFDRGGVWVQYGFYGFD